LPPPGTDELALFSKGVNEFNAREFFQCHETLEKYWTAQSGEERELTQGIIQIAVGYHHLFRDNQKGALKLLKRGLERISGVAPGRLGIDTTLLAKNVARSIADIEKGKSPGEIELPTIVVISN